MSKKLKVGVRYFRSKVVPALAEETKSKIINLDDVKDTRDMLESSIDASSNNFVEELSDLFAIMTNTNKEFLFVFQQIVSEYLKFNVIGNINKKYKLEFETKDIFRIIVRNIIIPTIIHDSFQTLIHNIGLKH